MTWWRPTYSKRFTHASSVVELLVQIDCKGCEDRVRKAISELDGVGTLEIDLDSQKVTVTGYLDQREVLKAARRAVRKAEFWPSPYDSQYHPFASQYLDHQQTFEPTYNYYVHGYNNGGVQGCLSDMPIMNDDRFHIFSEENVNACSIM
uniref:HMA domain-containing protein n=1 Tax=Kalanchoe fedtschenkoi TaxID=63787 RepID=A0A7N0USK3_KALFE